MIERFSQNEYNNTKFTDFLPCECVICGNIFSAKKKEIARERKNSFGHVKYCSKECLKLSFTKSTERICGVCGRPVTRAPKDDRKSKTGIFFCSLSCAASFTNCLPTRKSRRSRIEVILEDHIKSEFPTVHFVFNDKCQIGHDLDIFIPEKKLAIEINGPYHYVPIQGQKKLENTIRIDAEKKAECEKQGIKLFVLDVSKQEWVSPATSKIYIDTLTDFLKKELEAEGVEPSSEAIQ